MTVPTTTLQATFVSESAAYDNTFGWYDSRTGLGGILFADVESEGPHAPLVAGVSTATFTVATDALPYIQFFLVSNGYNVNRGDADDLTGAVKVIRLSDGSWAVADVDSHGNVITEHGKPDILKGSGANALFTETSKNAGNIDYASSVAGGNQTAATLAGDTADGPTGTLAWEDLAATRNKHGVYGNPGDADYNDAVFNISIVGGNHAPLANADTASVSEDAGATTINVLANDTDADVGDTLHVTSVNAAGLLGTVAIAAGGASISYTPASSFQSLAAGETATETFSYTVADQSGATSTANVTVTIVGANDAPAVASAVAGSGNEGSGTFSVNLLIGASDIDHGAVLHVENLLWTDTGSGLPAGFTFSGNAMSVDTDNLAYNAMGQGETFVTHFSYDVVDQFGALVHQTAAITITGTNDAPTVTAAVSGGGNEGTGAISVNLLANASDPDHGAVLHVENLLWTDAGSGLPAGFTFSGNAISVDTDNLAYNAMGQGETFVTHFSYDVVDQFGALVHQTAAITITGTNDAPTVTAAVSGGGNEDSIFSVDLLQNASDADHGAILHVANVQWDEVPGNLPAGFAIVGNSLTVDATGGAYQGLAQGETFVTHFTYDVVDEYGATTTQHATITITGTNDAPVAVADVTGGVVESGVVVGGNTPLAGNPTASGNVLGNDSDVDHGDSLSVVTTGDFTGTYGTLHLNADGSYTYTLNNADPDTNALAQGESVSDVFGYTIADSLGATASSTLSVNISGTNDQPVITAGPTTGGVKEDTVNSATGQLVATDPDHGAQEFWSVVGGSGAANADYHFRADTFAVTGAVPGGSFTDTFSDGNPPPSAPNFANGASASYVTTGGFTETGGELHIDSNNAVSVVNVGNPDPLIGNIAILRTNIDPGAPTTGLKLATNFTVSGVFDLITPDSPRETYGIRLTDRLVGGPGNPPDQLGDNTYDLVVRENPAGANLVTLRHIDFATNATTNVQSFTLAPPPGADQIKLIFTHAANSTNAIASFQYLSAGAVVGGGSFGATAPIFAPGSTDTEIWTRAAMVTYAPATSDSLLSGNYGTLDIDQTGTWTYNLDNTRIVTQNLAEGQHATDTFTVQVADQYGATDTRTINIDVVGTNDAPIMQTAAVSRALSEDSGVDGSGNLTATGLAQFSDVDLTDAHTLSAALQSATLSGGGSLPAGLSTLLANAIGTPTLIDPSTGDGHGQLQWNFALANSATQFLAQGQTLTLHYNVTATDPFGAAATQDVAITITGTNDAPVIAADVSGPHAITEGAAATDVVNGSLAFTDVDLSDQHTVASAFFNATWSGGPMLPAGLNDALSSALNAQIATDATGGATGTVTFAFGLADGNLDFLGQGETLAVTYNVSVSDGLVTSTQPVTITVTGTDDAPVLAADTSGPHSISELPGVTGSAVADVASGSLTFTDVDLNDHHTVSSTLASATWSGGATLPDGLTDVLGSAFNALVTPDTTGGGTGTITFGFGPADSAFDFLAAGETLTVTYNVTVDDGHGGTSTQPVTITVAGANDTPVISGQTTGTVTEDAVSPGNQATGQLTAFDPDHGATQTWTVVGGTASSSADYHFRMDSFSVVKGTTVVLQDDFSDGLPPPNSPPLNPNGTPTPTTYAGLGSFTESGGKLFLDSNNAVSFVGVGTPDPFIGQDAIVKTNIDPTNATQGLKIGQPFTIAGLFDLVLPDSPREEYGIRFTDRLIGGPGTPPDQQGNNVVELVVREGISGNLQVALRKLDFQNDVTTNIQFVNLNAPAGADQIRLVLDHSATDGQNLHASFQYMSGGVAVGATQAFSSLATIFQGENWGRAELVADAPAFTDSLMAGSYGTLDVSQSGTWNYILNNGLATTQSLAQGQTAIDTFTVQVADDHGAVATTPVNVTVVGTNDAPIMLTGPAAQAVTENGNTLTATGQAQFSDADLADTHTVATALSSTSTTGGAVVSAGLTAALQNALTAGIFDPATGDGHGQYQWNFSVSDSDVSYLNAGQSVTAVYQIAVTDSSPFAPSSHASTTQTVTITINGADDVVPTNYTYSTLTEPDNNNVYRLVINDLGQAAGYYADPSVGGSTSFEYSNGISTPIEVPLALYTQAWDINNSGQITGNYDNGDTSNPFTYGHVLGFLYDSGSYTSLLPSSDPAWHFIYPTAINGVGQVVGDDHDTRGADYGFLYSNGTFTSPAFGGDVAQDINDSGQIVGFRISSLIGDPSVAYIDDHGNYTLLSLPGSSGDSYALAINNSGDVVGWTGNNGFLYSSGVYTAINDPLAIGTQVRVINDSGQAAGTYTNASGTYGFVYSNGHYTTIDPAGSTNVHVDAINDFGQVSGTYQDASGKLVGFIATPTSADHAPFITALAPSNDLTEQGGSVAGTATSVVNLTIGDSDSVASYDTTGWTSIDATHFSKTGVYGSAVLDTSANTLTYTLNNADPDTNALSTGQTVSDNFNVGVKEDNGALTASTDVSFTVHGTSDGPAFSDLHVMILGSTAPGQSATFQQPISDLSAFGFASVASQNSTSPIDPASLNGYDVVLAFADWNPDPGVSNVLKNFVDSGGGVVVATYSMSPIAGDDFTGGIMSHGYAPLQTSTLGTVSGHLVATNPNDSVFDGIDLNTLTFWSNDNYAHPVLDGGATLLATDGNGIDMVARNATGNVMSINIFPGAENFGDSALYHLFANALNDTGHLLLT